jgi:ABC-type bacteriocin/lantibiotic exporter with double-glycine peptidase domain
MRVPVFLAQAPTEMGITCLRMTMAAAGKVVGQEEVRLACGVSRSGTDLAALTQGAKQFGFDAVAVDVHALLSAPDPDGSQLPAIALWEGGHAVVLLAPSGASWELIDPIVGRRSMTNTELAKSLVGPAIVLKTRPEFIPSPRRPGLFQAVLGRHPGSNRGLTYVVLTGLALIVPGIVTPGLLRVFIDGYLATGNRDGASTIIAGLALALILTVVLTAMQLSALRQLTTITVTSASARFVWHLLRMPAWFMGQRDPALLANRVALTESIALVMSGPLASAILSQVTSLFFLIIMFFLSPALAGVALIGYLILIALIMRIVPKRLEVRQRQSREAAVTLSEISMSMRVLETLKATGSENVAFDRIYASLGRRLTLGYTHLWGWLGMLPIVAVPMIGTMVVTIGGWLAIRGSLTLGTFAAFSILLAAFVAPIAVLVPSLDAFFSLRGKLEQANDVLEQRVDPRLRDPYLDVDESVTALPGLTDMASTTTIERVSHAILPAAGTTSEDDANPFLEVARLGRRNRGGLAIDPWAATLTLDDVTFGYSPSEPPLFSHVSLTIEPGRVVAIVGKSGSGKSTIGRLVAGLYQPSSGVIRIDGTEIDEFPRAALAREVGFVDQDAVIYQASVLNNLTMFDPEISDRDVVSAAKSAVIHDDIIARPGGYDAILREDGRDLSGGQRQRLGIARALVRQPRLLILDEATSAMDARTEAHIVSQLRARGCTTLVVAHRLSTVRDADEIIVLNGGTVDERGSHAELVRRNGLYRDLMNA